MWNICSNVPFIIDSTVLPSLTDFVTAMTIHIPQLQLYSWVAKDLQTWIDNSKKIYQEAEDEVGKVTPSLFREFSQANEEGRAELLVRHFQLQELSSTNYFWIFLASIEAYQSQ